MAGAILGAGVWTYLQYGMENSSYDSYLRATSPEGSQRAWDNNRLQNTLFVISQYTLGAIYVGQIVDAALRAPRQEKQKLRVMLLPNAGSIELAWTW